jgi:hypothetical protein
LVFQGDSDEEEEKGAGHTETRRARRGEKVK